MQAITLGLRFLFTSRQGIALNPDTRDSDFLELNRTLGKDSKSLL